MITAHFGWIDDQQEVEKVVSKLPIPLATTIPVRGNESVLLSNFFRKAIGKDAPKGPQGIGDCVSWAWGNLVNYLQAGAIYKTMAQKKLLSGGPQVVTDAIAALRQQYQETATESIYGLSRVEVGGQRGSMQDGSVGAWAGKAVTTYGTLSRPYLQNKGLGGAYDPKRAKQWGAQGLPDSLEPDARQHLVKNVSLVLDFDQAAGLIENGYPVAVCSGQGFTTTRDRQGFCLPRGQWQHAMLFMGARYDRPGLLCSQSWGQNSPNGPLALDQPDNTFWVDAKVVNVMLSRRDSFTGTAFDGYYIQDEFNGDWSH